MKGLIEDVDASEQPTFISFKGSEPVVRKSFEAPIRAWTFNLHVWATLSNGDVETAHFVLRVLRPSF